MIEAMVGVSVALMALLGVITLLTRSLRINAEVGQHFVGTYLAAEGIEVVKNMIDANYADHCAPWNREIGSRGDQQRYFVDYGSTELKSGDDNLGVLCFSSQGLYGNAECSKASPSLFWRALDIKLIDDDHMQVVATVHQDGKEIAQLEDHFFNWRKCAQ